MSAPVLGQLGYRVAQRGRKTNRTSDPERMRKGAEPPDVSLLPRIAAYFSPTLDELLGWRDELTEAESAALYAEVYALATHTLSDCRYAFCSGAMRRLSRAFWSALLCVQASRAIGRRSKRGSVAAGCLMSANEKYQARAMLT